MKRNIVANIMLGVFLALSVLAGCSSNNEPVTGEDFPSKTITIVNASSPGSPTDIMARSIARYMADDLGVSVIVENASGAGGANMMSRLMQEPADGYTIATANAANMTNTYDLIKEFSFDDFDFLVNVQEEPYALATLSDSSIATFKEIMELGKEKNLRIGGQVNILSSMLEQIAEEAYGFELPYTPFKGGSESVTNLLGGNVDVISSSPTTLKEYIMDGSIRILAITGTQRLEDEGFEDVPTLLELGYENTEPTSYRGLIARKGMPQEVKDKLVESITNALDDPSELNIEVTGYKGPEEFMEYAKQAYDSYVQIVSKGQN